jgi:hypothetical protein
MLLLDYGINGLPSFFVFFLGCVLITLSVRRKFSSNDEPDSKLFFAILLPVLCLNILFFTVFCPVVTDTARLGKLKYYIVEGVDDDFHSYRNFYKCKKWSFDCQSLYSSYDSPFGSIIIDEQKGEINLLSLGASSILYTDGEQPRFYAPTTAQFRNHKYQFSQKCNDLDNEQGFYDCGNYTFTLYECNLDYRSCDPFPVQYTTGYYDTLFIIEGDEHIGELNIYNGYPEEGGILIASYGKNPRCYVEGCEILEVK